MKIFTYKMVRDYGFAPNPFFGICTLANCKPKIRKAAQLGDWIMGTGAKQIDLKNRLLFLMQVTDKVTFDEYWSSDKFQLKKPNVNGSLVQMHGDNIYSTNNQGFWCQSDSHHSKPFGVINDANLKRDISGKFVLISNRFYYFGDKHLKVPEEFLSLCSTNRDFEKKSNIELSKQFINWVNSKYETGIHGDPIHWQEYNQLTLW